LVVHFFNLHYNQWRGASYFLIYAETTLTIKRTLVLIQDIFYFIHYINAENILICQQYLFTAEFYWRFYATNQANSAPTFLSKLGGTFRF
jgi:hypothetical protein